MKLSEIKTKLNLSVLTGSELLDREVIGGYASDMLSDVIANAKKNNIWITLQTHLNIVAVASMKEISAIILVNGRVPEESTIKKAEEEKIPLLMTEMNAYQVAGNLFQLNI
jgi:predicted transcriptional regulator